MSVSMIRAELNFQSDGASSYKQTAIQYKNNTLNQITR